MKWLIILRLIISMSLISANVTSDSMNGFLEKGDINDSEIPLEEDYLPDEWIIDNSGYTFNVPQNSYLLLGDNRNNSEDARYWGEIAIQEGKAQNMEDAEQYRYIKTEDIYAKMLFKIFL